MESNQADQILAALPWRCFQCDFVTSDPEEAAAHFGDRDDGEEFKPICKWWARMDDTERLETLQDTIRDLNKGADENMRLLTKIEGLEYQVSSQEGAIRSYKPFRDCRSIHDVFCLYDSMEGRALVAEEQLRRKHPAEPPARVAICPKCDRPHYNMEDSAACQAVTTAPAQSAKEE